MNYDFRFSPDFIRGAKTLLKRYPSLKNDLAVLRQRLEENPYQGVDLGGGFHLYLRQVRCFECERFGYEGYCERNGVIVCFAVK